MRLTRSRARQKYRFSAVPLRLPEKPGSQRYCGYCYAGKFSQNGLGTRRAVPIVNFEGAATCRASADPSISRYIFIKIRPPWLNAPRISLLPRAKKPLPTEAFFA
ncbi:hypothetical protein KL86DES1_10313 [uncultured Desulfovibrio sp.]|uniref:Uncharacterized protein n=1 Tax=uncultured Desulfovibrio sp. TaxID=167968 RepID=A0A212KYT5_9BACT|nr:hypothetical protein KL86DES1_10313 [uncultured Desulfovibrio sp.]VZH32185.1 conserved protein of unknown function [Desulfovibrio sp. 86]